VGVVYIDPDDGIRRVMNNTKLYAKLLGKFCEETNLEPVYAAINAGNNDEAQGLVHTIKGVTANLSIKDLNEKLVEAEAQIKAGSLAPGLIDTIKASYAATIPEVKKVIEQYV
jgi:HPt (histidine-containing phosphotransfer) domain-containing protein